MIQQAVPPFGGVEDGRAPGTGVSAALSPCAGPPPSHRRAWLARCGAWLGLGAALPVAWAGHEGDGSPAPTPSRRRYESANRQVGLPRPDRPRVVLMGDSITDAWPRQQPALFAREDLEMVGRGISGETTRQMLQRFDADVLALRPRVLVLLGGTNDIAENAEAYEPEQTFDRLGRMTALASSHGIAVVLCTLLPAYDYPWRRGLAPAPKILALNARLRVLAQSQGLPFVDYHAALRDERDGLPITLSDDGVHPNADAYRRMSERLEPALQVALRDAQG